MELKQRKLSKSEWDSIEIPVSSNENEILQLIPKTFNFKKDERKIKDIGFIAQDVLPIIPDAVRSDMDGEEEYYAMNYSNLVPVLVKAIQELSAKVDAQAAEINELKNK